MSMGRKLWGIIFLFILTFVFLTGARPVSAQENKVNIHLFWSKTCPHCAKEKVFLEKLEQTDDKVKVYLYELNESRDNQILLQKVGKELKADISYVPFTVIGDEYFSGYLDEATTGKKIEELVESVKRQGCRDVVGELTGLESNTSEDSGEGEACEETEKNVIEELNFPIIGKISTKNLSLPALTFLIAMLDGFNPCAMWVLLFLISLLLGMKDRRRMWALGTTFIVSSAAVYFLFLSAWLNLFLFLGFVVWMRVLVGLVALGSGSYYLYDWQKNKDGGCAVTGDERRKKVFEKLREVTQDRRFAMALIGIVLLAFAVNLVELVCSAGLPAVYTQILSLTEMSRWQYYLYLIFYILVFMLDDLVVFIVAMTTLKAVGVESKYARYSHFIGGILMVFIGLAMLFKPEILMFG